MKKWMMSIKALVLCLAIVIMPSCGNDGGGLPQNDSVKGPIFTVVDGKLLMTIKLLNLQMDAGFAAPIPRTINSRFELAPNVEDGGMMLVVTMDLEDLRNIDIGVGDGNTLPDGRPLPGIPGGRLEGSLRIDLGQKYRNLSFYYHKKLFGVSIPFGFDTLGMSGYWNINIKGKNVGFIGVVGNEPARDLKAVGVVLLRLENLGDKRLKKLIKLSKQNPHLIY